MTASAMRPWLPAALVLVLASARAEPAPEAVRSSLDGDTVAALKAEGASRRWSPEVSATRTRLTPPGAPAVDRDGHTLQELGGVQARLWLSHGRTAVGMGVGTLGYVRRGVPATAAPVSADAPVGLTGATPTVSLGMRYRMTRDSAVFADAMGAHALPPAGGYINTKVGMEWKPASSRFGLDGGALGMQFDSGYRLSLKARRDGIRVYLRGQF